MPTSTDAIIWHKTEEIANIAGEMWNALENNGDFKELVASLELIAIRCNELRGPVAEVIDVLEKL